MASIPKPDSWFGGVDEVVTHEGDEHLSSHPVGVQDGEVNVNPDRGTLSDFPSLSFDAGSNFSGPPQSGTTLQRVQATAQPKEGDTDAPNSASADDPQRAPTTVSTVVGQSGKRRRRVAPTKISENDNDNLPGESEIGSGTVNGPILPRCSGGLTAWQWETAHHCKTLERLEKAQGKAERRARGEEVETEPDSDTDEDDYWYHHKYEVDAELEFGPLGESGSEIEYDAETWKEVKKERREKEKRDPISSGPTRKPRLSQDEANAAVQEEINALIEKWKKTELPKREQEAWRVWNQSKRRKTMDKEIRDADERIEKLDDDILRIQNDISRMCWTSKLQARKLVTGIERSIFEREDLRWKKSILSGDPPWVSSGPRTSRVTASRPRRRELGRQSKDMQGVPQVALRAGRDALEEDGNGDFSEADDEASENGDPLEEAFSEDQSERERNASARKGDGRVIRSTDNTVQVNLTSTNGPSSADTQQSASKEHTQQQESPPSDLKELSLLCTDRSASEEPHVRSANGDSWTNEVVHSDSDENPFRNPDVMDIQHQTGMQRQPPSQEKMADPDPAQSNAEDDPSDDGEIASDGEPLGAYHEIEKICSRPVQYYENRLDRKRLLINLLANSNSRPWFASRISARSEAKFRREISDVWRRFRLSKPPPSWMNAATFQNIVSLGKMYSAWYDCKVGKDRGFLHGQATRMLSDVDAFHQFYRFLRQALGYFDGMGQNASMDPASQSKGKRKKGMGFGNGLSQASDSDGHRAQNKRRKRAVNEDTQARDVREDDKRRLQEQEARRRQLEKAFQASGRSLNQDPSLIMVNIGKDESQPPIYINPSIGGRIKEHQIEGVRFMWREIVTKDEARRGCLLAHEMGLGKTMQVITLLVVIAEAAQSPIRGISEQVPEDLRLSRTLVLCAAGLIDNWQDEVLLWAPKDTLGRLSKLDSSMSLPQRLREIATWHDKGGVLIVSYHMFRDLIANNPTKGSGDVRAPRIDIETHEQLKRQLLDGPTIIVTDEAHTIKNESSGLAMTTSRFRSRSRIALTGSPLANNLKEYFTTINWAVPGYLGPWGEFKDKYADPIGQGIYKDSTQAQIRQSLMLLHALKMDLEPKVQRADVSVLKGLITTKTEFVIKIPLTPLQAQAYALFVRSALSTDGSKAACDGLLDWLANLTLLCIHPQCFLENLKERQTKSTNRKAKKLRESANQLPPDGLGIQDAVPEETSMSTLGIPEETPVSALFMDDMFISEQLALLEEDGESLKSPTQSHRIQILVQILDVAAKAGDKCLIFSQRLLVLDYLADLFRRSKRRFARLDGTTSMSTRHQDVKGFNKKGSPDVYLLSTKAGGLGLNLPAANRVIIMDFSFNPAWEIQAIGRAYRLGQKKPVYVYRFLAGGTIEDTVYNQALFKTNLATRVVDKLNPTREAQKNVKDYFFEPKKVPQTDLSGCKGKDPLVLDEILAKQERDQIIRSITLSESFREDEGDVLTAQEELQAKQLLEESKLKRSYPDANKKVIDERQSQLLQPKATGVSLDAGPGDIFRLLEETKLKNRDPTAYAKMRQERESELHKLQMQLCSQGAQKHGSKRPSLAVATSSAAGSNATNPERPILLGRLQMPPLPPSTGAPFNDEPSSGTASSPESANARTTMGMARDTSASDTGGLNHVLPNSSGVPPNTDLLTRSATAFARVFETALIADYPLGPNTTQPKEPATSSGGAQNTTQTPAVTTHGHPVNDDSGTKKRARTRMFRWRSAADRPGLLPTGIERYRYRSYSPTGDQEASSSRTPSPHSPEPRKRPRHSIIPWVTMRHDFRQHRLEDEVGSD